MSLNKETKPNLEKKLDGKYKDAVCCFEQILEATPNKISAVWPLTFHLTNK